MPDALPLLVTTGVGVGVLAGVVSGVCYLISNGFGINRSNFYHTLQAPFDLEHCSVCGSKYRVIGVTAEPCSGCSRTFCRHSCGTFCEDTEKWNCKSCIKSKSVKFKSGLDFLNQIQKSLTFRKWTCDTDTNLNRASVTDSGTGASQWAPLHLPAPSPAPRVSSDAVTRLQIRDFLEQLASQLTGGPLDDVSVSRMYNHHQYLPQTMVSGVGAESASSAHARLKRLVQRVIEEAMALPAMLDYSGLKSESTSTPKLPDFDAKTYEDLLATAILNKVIDRYQQDYERDRERSSGIHSESASPSGSHVDDEVDLNSNCLGKNQRALESGLGNERSTPSPSSVEPLSRDGSINSENSDRFHHRASIVDNHKIVQTVYSSDEEFLEEKNYNSPLAGALATIDFSHKNRVPFPEYGGDIVDLEVSQELPYLEITSEELLNTEYHLNGDIHTVNNTWEENWLFQKKRLKTTQSVPVPMLVPNSNMEYRAMIGDRDAEDTTDLSEAGSDEDEHSIENDIKHVLVNSKTIIGGKNLGSLLDLADDLNDDGEDVLTPIVEDKIKDPFDILDVKNKNENVSQNIEVSRTNPKEVVAMLVETDSGPLAKAEFTVSEIHRGLTTHEIETVKNIDSLNLNNTSETTVQSEFIENLSNITNADIHNNIQNYINTFTEATNLDVVDYAFNNNEHMNSLQQKESEYSETIAVPVQRHLDSLKRMTRDTSSKYSSPKAAPRSIHADVLLESNDVENLSDADYLKKIEVNGELSKQIPELPPDSIAVREKQKWLKAVPMPNNPYSAEAIEKRLSNKSSSIFDIINNGIPINNKASEPVKETITPTKNLKDVLTEDVSDYHRYGRDYYIKEAKQSAGSCKKSPSLPQNNSNEMGTTIKRESPVLVSVRKSLNELEASTLHNNITRVSLTPRNASSQFAKNPLYKAEKLNETNLVTTNRWQSLNRLPVFEDTDTDLDDDSVRFKIQGQSDVTEKLFCTLRNVRNNDSLRSSKSLTYARQNAKHIFGENMYS